MNLELLASSELWNRILSGLPVTLALVAWSLLAGLVAGFPLARARLSPNAALRSAAAIYLFVFRGTPALVLLYLVYYGLAQVEAVRESVFWRPLLRHAYWCAVIALSLQAAAYGAEIIRGAILAIPRGEMEAARALGMGRFRTAWRIGFPHAIRAAFGPYSNEVVLSVKATAAVSLIGVFDVLGQANVARRELLDPLTPLVAAGIVYLAVVAAVRIAASLLEAHLNRHMRESRSRGGPRSRATELKET